MSLNGYLNKPQRAAAQALALRVGVSPQLCKEQLNWYRVSPSAALKSSVTYWTSTPSCAVSQMWGGGDVFGFKTLALFYLHENILKTKDTMP